MQTSHFLPRTIARQVSSTGRRRLLPGVIPAPPLSLCHYDQPSRPYSSPSKPSSASRPSSPWTSATGSDLGNTANRTTAAGASGGVGGGGDTKYERVGPFPVGAGLGENVRTKKWAPWKDLDVGGKGMLPSVLVILIGFLKTHILALFFSLSRSNDGSNGQLGRRPRWRDTIRSHDHCSHHRALFTQQPHRLAQRSY